MTHADGLLDGMVGRRVVVTGASKGIGRAIVDELLTRRARVLAVARGEDGLRQARADWADLPGDVTILAADVFADEGRERVRDGVDQLWGGLDVLVNNAATNVRKDTLAYESDEIEALIRADYVSVLEMSRLLHPLLMGGRSPAIVTVSSTASQRCARSGVVYASAKAAVEQMTRYLAVEWAPQPDRPGIRVNAVAPWYIRTPLVEPVLSDPARLSRIIDRTPMRRVGEPAEVAAAVVFLASPGAGYITGACLPVDGGFMADGL
jgi:Tropinone reductase 1